MENQQKIIINNQKVQTNGADKEIGETEQPLSETETQQNHMQEIVDLKKQIELLQDKLLRVIAESDNSRKRLEKSIEDTKDYAIVAFAKDLLSVSDNLSRALEHKPQNINDVTTNIIAGVKMTKDELAGIFQKYSLESITPSIGDKFDYNVHHAVSHVITDEYDQDSIIKTMQLGYKIKDRLLRPAMVQVAKRSD